MSRANRRWKAVKNCRSSTGLRQLLPTRRQTGCRTPQPLLYVASRDRLRQPERRVASNGYRQMRTLKGRRKKQSP